jgi:hypothetical protein
MVLTGTVGGGGEVGTRGAGVGVGVKVLQEHAMTTSARTAATRTSQNLRGLYTMGSPL